MRYDFQRSDWLAGMPFSGPAFDWSRITQVVIHYVGGGPNYRPPANNAQSIRNAHAFYLNRRGYSYGYNAEVVSSVGHPQDGSSWEIRGDRFRCAANAGVNEISFAVHVRQRDNEPPSPKAVEAIRGLVAQVRAKSPNHVRIVGHNGSGGSTRTSCPGTGLQHAVVSGLFEPVVVPDVPEGDEMIAIYKPVFAGANAATPWVAVFQSGAVRRAVNADVRLAERLRVPIVDQDSKEQHDYLISIFIK